MKTLLNLAATLSLAALFTSNANAQITDPAPYCEGTYDNDYNMFSSVTISGTTHNIGAQGGVGQTGGYKYYNTFVFPDITIGAATNMSIVSYTVSDGEPIYFAVYIDINHNNTFDANEVFMQNNNTINDELKTFGQGGATQTITKSITIPATAMAGKTRMRVIRGQHTDNAKLYGPYDPTYTLSACHTIPPPAVPGDPGGDNSYGICYDYNVTLKKTGGTAINDVEQLSSFNLYPNPAANVLNVDLGNGKNAQSASVVDLMGRVMIQNRAVNKNQVDISDLAKGVYMIRLSQKDGNYTSWVRFVKG